MSFGHIHTVLSNQSEGLILFHSPGHHRWVAGQERHCQPLTTGDSITGCSEVTPCYLQLLSLQDLFALLIN